MGQPVMHFEVIAKDTAKLRAFYAKLFGWRAEPFPGTDYTMMHADQDRGITSAVGADTAGLPPGIAVYVQVEDVERFLGQARKLGATKVLQEPFDVPEVGRFAVFTDPEGNRVGLWKLPTG